MGVLEVLAPWPKGYPLLADRYDDLHPIMIGPKELCLKLQHSLGGKVWIKDATTHTSLLWVPKETMADANARRRAKAFLVPRDVTTAAEPSHCDNSLGEFSIGGRVFYTFRRHRELIQRGLLPRLEGYSYRHLIQPKYCKLAEIDPEEMIVDFFQDESTRTLFSEVDIVFSKLPSTLPQVERILLAHKQVLGRPHVNPKEFEELWTFVKMRYFDGEKG